MISLVHIVKQKQTRKRERSAGPSADQSSEFVKHKEPLSQRG